MSDAEIKQAYTLVKQPTSIPVPGKKPLDEFIGKLNTGTDPARKNSVRCLNHNNKEALYGSVCIRYFNRHC